MSRGIQLDRAIADLESAVLRHPEIGPVAAPDFARMCNRTRQNVYDWIKRGIIRPKSQESSTPGFIDPLDTLERWNMINEGKLMPRAEVIPKPFEQAHLEVAKEFRAEIEKVIKEEPSFPDWLPNPILPQFDEIRSRAIKAAREAYRDEILDAADKTKDQDLEIKLLREFVHAEEQFKVIFEERK